jgi:cytochrome c oxidase subunit 3
MSDATLRETAPLPVGSIGRHASGWWGVLTVIMTEGALFAYLLFSYYYFAVQYGREFLPDRLPGFRLSLPNTIILLASSVAVWWGERAGRRGERGKLLVGLAGGFVLGAVFMAIQYLEWRDKPFAINSSSYGSLYFTITGFHMMHVLAGLIVLAALLVWTALGYFDRVRNAPVTIGAVYWHFVDAVWLTLFFTFYITPHLG